MTDNQLRNQFRRLDRTRNAAIEAEQQLKAMIAIRAREQGLLVNPRPESVRAQLKV